MCSSDLKEFGIKIARGSGQAQKPAPAPVAAAGGSPWDDAQPPF